MTTRKSIEKQKVFGSVSGDRSGDFIHGSFFVRHDIHYRHLVRLWSVYPHFREQCLHSMRRFVEL